MASNDFVHHPFHQKKSIYTFLSGNVQAPLQ